MSRIEVANMSKSFGAFKALQDVSFTAESGEIVVIVGASGCGKTTTLRCLAGLEKPSSGTITIGGNVIVSDAVYVPPEKRGIGMIFQSYALWPHMTVYDNIAYGLQLKNVARSDITKRVAEVISLVSLTGMEQRFPSMLSGGQQQRVALARSLVTEPSVLLLDEPLSNLDAKLREQMRSTIRSILKRYNITAVHITHDQLEAIALADKVICMRGGMIEQVGKPEQLYNQPATKFVADFIGAANFIDATAHPDPGSDLMKFALPGGVFLYSSDRRNALKGADALLAVRPENFGLSSVSSGDINEVVGIVADRAFLGEYYEYSIAIGDARIKSRQSKSFDVYAQIYVNVDPQKVLVFER